MRQSELWYTVKDVINCQTPEGKTEKFIVTKVGRKYVYLVSEQYSSDGSWYILKTDQNKPPRAHRC